MVFLLPGVKFDFDLIQKYDTRAPRYTSYPPATELTETFTAENFQTAITASNQRKTPLSLYFHIPFCQSACYFCGCNTVITNNKNMAIPYLEHLEQEIKNTSALIDKNRQVLQIHWGGGTPNYLELEQVEFLWKNITRNFQIAENAEVSIEINPRYVNREYILFLRDIGFNRISFGIQDFHPEVQKAVNRIQPEDADRIVVFNFAYVPWIKPVQKMIPQAALPGAEEKLDILKMTIEELTNHEYLFIGMDHFAKNNNELAIAQSHGTLKRNFQGYTTHAETELFGFGATSISMLEDAYAQNHKELKDYYQAVAAGIIPISKGIQLTQDDIIRRDVIMSIMSHFHLNKLEIEQKYHLDFNKYFCYELQELQPLENDGLVNVFTDEIHITDIGRLLVRNIAVLFDTHTRNRETKFSRAI